MHTQEQCSMLPSSIDDDRAAIDHEDLSNLAEELHVGPVLARDVVLLPEQDGGVPEK